MVWEKNYHQWISSICHKQITLRLCNYSFWLQREGWLYTWFEHFQMVIGMNSAYDWESKRQDANQIIYEMFCNCQIDLSWYMLINSHFQNLTSSTYVSNWYLNKLTWWEWSRTSLWIYFNISWEVQTSCGLAEK